MKFLSLILSSPCLSITQAWHEWNGYEKQLQQQQQQLPVQVRALVDIDCFFNWFWVFLIMKMSAPVSLEDNVMLHKRCLYSAVTLLSLLCFGRQTIKGQTTVVSSRVKRLPTQPLTRITPPTRRTLLHPWRPHDPSSSYASSNWCVRVTISRIRTSCVIKPIKAVVRLLRTVKVVLVVVVAQIRRVRVQVRSIQSMSWMTSCSTWISFRRIHRVVLRRVRVHAHIFNCDKMSRNFVAFVIFFTCDSWNTSLCMYQVRRCVSPRRFWRSFRDLVWAIRYSLALDVTFVAF